MKKKFRISKAMPTGYKSYEGEASSFWFDDISTDFRINIAGKRSVDHTKLASAQRAIGNFVSIVTGKKIPVIFQSTDNSYTDGEKVVIGTKLEDNNFDPAVGLALHEGSHILLTDFSLLEDFYYTGSTFHTAVAMQGCDPEMDMTGEQLHFIKDLLNWVEDRRIDYHIYTTAPGYRKYYEAMYDKYFNSRIVDKALQSSEKTDEDVDSYMFRLINLTNTNRNLDALVGLREIWDVVDLKNIDRLKTTEDTLKVSCEIYKIIKKHVKAAEQKKKEDQAGNGEPDDQQKKEKSECKGEDPCTSGNINDGEEKECKTPEGEAPPDDGSKAKGKRLKDLSTKEIKRLSKAIAKQKEFNSGDVKKMGKLSKKDNRIVKTLKESGTESVSVETSPGQPDPAPVETVVIKKMTPAVVLSMDGLFDCYSADSILNDGEEWEGEDTWKYRNIRNMNTEVHKGIMLGKQLGRKLHLRNEEKTLKSTRLKTGKIDRRLISQLGFNNASVFHRIITDSYKNFFIHISIDASGSMGGRRIENAVKSAVAIAQAASMTTGIRVQISLRGTSSLGQSNNSKTVTLYAYDSAYDKMSKIKTYFKFLKTFGVTPEGIAFESMFRDIKKDSKGDECIFINYSDGMPSHISGVNWEYSGVEFTRRVVKKMIEIDISVIGYFIDGKKDGYSSEMFKRMYGKDSEFIDTSNMTKVSRSMNRKFLEISE